MSKYSVDLSGAQFDWLSEQVAAGHYPDAAAVIEALIEKERLAALRADVQAGLDDIAAGRVVDFDPIAIAERGKEKLARRSS